MESLEDDKPFEYKIIQRVAELVNTTDIRSFEVVPADPALMETRTNTCPVMNLGVVLGLESWAVRYVLPYAHKIVLQRNKKDIIKFSNCLLMVNLLYPQLPTTWNIRKELVLSNDLPIETELDITALALSVDPKCNEALAYRRWLFKNKLTFDKLELGWELKLTRMLAQKYPNNYHAWSHRQWCLQQFPQFDVSKLPYECARWDVINDELKLNLLFISRNVSDHSAVHHRMFVIQEYISLAHKISLAGGTQDDYEDNDYQSYIVKFLKDCNVQDVENYITKVRAPLSVYDAIIGFLLKELESNMSLIKTYEYHESLWCYRRSIIYKFCTYIRENRFYWKNFADVLINQLVNREKIYLDTCIENKGTLFDGRILRNYCKWLKLAAKLDLVVKT